MELAPTNWGAVFAGTAIYVIVGAIWYSPKLFGGLWMSATGLSKEQLRNPGIAFLFAIINAFVAVFVLSQFIHHLEAHAASDGACVAF